MAGYVSVRLMCTLSCFVRIVTAVVAAVTKEVEVDATTGTGATKLRHWAATADG
jgi:hypothetical protein